jgi:hypothetical protein
MSAIAQISAGALAIVTASGIAWWIYDLRGNIAKEKQPLEALETKGTPQQIGPAELIDLGTGPMAEEVLGSKIANARTIVFVAGAMTSTVYSLIRNYLPPNVALEVLVNPALGGRVHLYNIATRYACRIRASDEIVRDLVTVFNVDGEMVLILRKENNGVLIAQAKSAAENLTAQNRAIWNRAKAYTV